LEEQFAISDKTLNAHIFGNIPLKPVDFRSPEVYKFFTVKKPKSKKEIFQH